jgi:hypothetical protein
MPAGEGTVRACSIQEHRLAADDSRFVLPRLHAEPAIVRLGNVPLAEGTPSAVLTTL